MAWSSPASGSAWERSQHFVGHLRKASKRWGVIVMLVKYQLRFIECLDLTPSGSLSVPEDRRLKARIRPGSLPPADALFPQAANCARASSRRTALT